MAVAHVDGKAVSWDGIANPQIPALTSHGNAVGVQILWNDVDSRTITSVKYGGSSGTNMTAVSGATKDQTGASSPLAPNAKGRGYQLITGSSGDDKVYIVFSGACTGSAHSQSVSGVDGADPIHASSGFGLGDSAGFAIANVARSFVLNQTGIPTDTDEIVVYSGMMYCGPGSTVTSITSSTGTASSSTTPLNSRTEGAAFYDTSDSTSEQAAVTLTAPQYYYTPSFAWLEPPGTAVMVGWAWNAGTGGGGVTLTAQGTTQSQTSENVALVQAHVLAAQNTTQAQTSENVDLELPGGGITLTAQPTTQSQASENVALTQANTLTAQNTSQSQVSQNVNLSLPGMSLSNPQATMTYNGWSSLTIDVDVA